MTSSHPPIGLSLLSFAHPAPLAETIHLEKVIQRPLHLKPTSTPPPTAQTLRRRARTKKLLALKKHHKPAPLSARQKRSLCLYDIPRSAQKYSIYLGLHALWVGYMQEILWEGGEIRPIAQGMLARVCAADFHGAEVLVVRSRCVSRVGVGGIVVRDLRGVFEVVTRGDGVKMLPKEGTVFRFGVPVPVVKDTEGGKEDGVEMEEGVEKETGMEVVSKEGGVENVEEKKKEVVFELHGNQFQYRATDRATKKFRAHYLPDL